MNALLGSLWRHHCGLVGHMVPAPLKEQNVHPSKPSLIFRMRLKLVKARL